MKMKIETVKTPVCLGVFPCGGCGERMVALQVGTKKLRNKVYYCPPCMLRYKKIKNLWWYNQNDSKH